MQSDFETAYAKINLALHVRKRRDDGYHELESLVAFLDDGDFLRVEAANCDSFSVEGEFAANSGDISDNLVVKTLDWARRATRDWGYGDIPPLAITLSKHLPVAAGLGGGSADAAALLRLLYRQQLLHSWPELCPATTVLGADVPACLFSQPLIMRGIGERIEPVEDNSLNGIAAVLVNPGVPVPTGPVFKAWDGVDYGGLKSGTALEMACEGRNDLERPALALCPAIGEVLAALRATVPAFARMSGSGATCFALYDDPQKAAFVVRKLKDRYPSWWVKAGSLTRCR
jgi:4-diphosphocytidyl-2-C-methyl-D-erythritol kinase